MFAAEPLPQSISIAGRAGHAFPPHAMLQGFACHARGVELQHATPAHVRARVRSKRCHDVELRAENSQLVIACSCAARSLGLVVCKHAWATLLEVDRNGGLEDLRKPAGSLAVIAAPHDAPKGEPPKPRIAGLAKTTAKARPAAKTKATASVPAKKKGRRAPR